MFTPPKETAPPPRVTRQPDRVETRVAGPQTGPDTNPLLALQRQAGNRAVTQLVAGAPVVQRDPPATAPATAPAGPAANTATHYQVGAITYTDDQFATAINEVVNLWTMVGGVLSKRQEAVAEFCGPGGAGAAATPSITDALLTAALTAALAAATDGVGVVLEGALQTGVMAIARRVAIDPSLVLSAGNAIVHKAVEAGKGQANTRIPAAVAQHAQGPPGGTQLATPLATYQSAMDAALDADVQGARASSLQDLLNLPASPVRWGVAAALYDALHNTLEQAKNAQWNATSDGWFGLNQASGAGTLAGVDSGIISIMLAADAYPSTRLRATGAYLGGPGANETTVARYNQRKLGEIHLVRRIVMDNGSLGHGIVPCGWEVDATSGGVDWHSHTRWGAPWLAAKSLGLSDIGDSDPRITAATVQAGAEAVWAEVQNQSAADLGASFAVTSATSGTGTWAGPG